MIEQALRNAGFPCHDVESEELQNIKHEMKWMYRKLKDQEKYKNLGRQKLMDRVAIAVTFQFAKFKQRQLNK
jgi:hypothetical protein